jgi:heme-degrading monooxygenase HmoA
MAYAAIRQYEMGAGSVSDFMRIVDEGLAETLSALPGFVGYHVITSGADEVVSVSIFDDEDGAVRSNQLAAEFVHDRLQQFQLNLTVAMSGEVRVARTAPLRV